VDRGACAACGYAIVPRISSGNGRDEALSERMAVLDSAGLCPFLAAGIDDGMIVDLLNAATGFGFSKDDIRQAGRRISRGVWTV